MIKYMKILLKRMKDEIERIIFMGEDELANSENKKEVEKQRSNSFNRNKKNNKKNNKKKW